MTGSELLLAASVDAILGDPRWLPHPVRGMGSIIAWCDRHVRECCRSSIALRAAGLMLAVGLPLCVFLLSHWLINTADSLSAWFGSLLSIALAWTTLAGRDLWNHVQRVHEQLVQGHLQKARQAVGMIVGRDTEEISEADIVRATIETTAESTADGIIAPLFYLTIGGAPLALAYKAVNTLDSMIGHRDERHMDFGWASARLDDVVNWIPARLSAVLLIVATGVVTFSAARILNGWRVLCRDGGKHPSPNSGRPEAAMAGLLGVQLGGTNNYDGVPHPRPLIGVERRQLVPGDIEMAARIMVATSLLSVILAIGIVWCI
jgi:adenosylcobinamide-phosphate synthase